VKRAYFAVEGPHDVEVQSLGGLSQIPRTLVTGLNNLDTLPGGIGILADADFEQSARKQFDSLVEKMARELADSDLELDLPSQPGVLTADPPRLGIFVLPNNQTQGTLEDLLLACAEKAYPSLLASAKAWIEPLDTADHVVFPKREDRREFSKPAGKAKAIAGCVANVLKPCKSIQVSIQDNEWLRNTDALQLPQVQSLMRFVTKIAHLAPEAPHE
jgi:hypothetical protein